MQKHSKNISVGQNNELCWDLWENFGKKINKEIKRRAKWKEKQ